MKVSELINKLHQVLETHGDVDVDTVDCVDGSVWKDMRDLTVRKSNERRPKINRAHAK